MSATAAEIATVRRMVDETESETYTDEIIQAAIEAHPLLDSDGYAPDETDWTPTYNLNAAAADIWEEKAAAVAKEYTFSAGGASFQQSNLQQQYLNMAKTYRARRVNYARALPDD